MLIEEKTLIETTKKSEEEITTLSLLQAAEVKIEVPRTLGCRNCMRRSLLNPWWYWNPTKCMEQDITNIASTLGDNKGLTGD